MKIVVTANGVGLESMASPLFGRCPVFVFVDSESMEFEAIENSAAAASGGAGVQAAQFVIERGAEAIVTGNVGPNAFDVLNAAGIPVYSFDGGTVQEAVEAYRLGNLMVAGAATAPEHAGMGRSHGMHSGGHKAPITEGTAVSSGQANSREQEIITLQGMARDLRKQLAEVIERLQRLEEGG